MKKTSVVYFTFIITLILGSCVKIKKPEALSEREQWINSFHDSIEIYQKQTADIEAELNNCNARMGDILNKFEHISNPREVTGYYILKGWKSKTPLTSTGIFARITENENLELIATLSGGTFNKISVSDGNSIAESSVVPHDQALNYRHSSYNTVCFSGEKTDSLIQFIANHHASALKLNFMEGGSNKKSFTIPADEKDMIFQTWSLFEAQLQQKQLQKQLWINSRKIATYRRMLESPDSLK